MAIEAAQFAAAEASPMVIDDIAIYPKIHGVHVLSIGSEYVDPRRSRDFEPPEQIAPHIARGLTLRTGPRGTVTPVAR